MDWTYPILAITVIVGVSYTAVRAGATALRMTGLSADAAGFQSLSAFFGVGYTTTEAELVVNHPVRRKIISILIIVGNIGLASGLSTIVISMVRSSDPTTTVASIVLNLVVLALLWMGLRYGVIQRGIDHLIQKALSRAGLVNVHDYETLLHTGEGYCVGEVTVEPGHPSIGKTLANLDLANRGVLVLTIHRADDTHIGTPDAGTELHEGDVLTVYGQEQSVRGFTEHD
ncbi:MAG: TrkA C-terminal domain-containing protein [Planctomycetota bacterium]